MRVILITILFSNFLFPVGGVIIFNDGTTIEGDVTNVNENSIFITPMGLTFPEEIRMENVDSLKQELRIWTSIENDLNLEAEDTNLYINSAKDISVGKITSFFKSNSQIKGLAMIKRKYLEEGSYFLSEIFGKIIINKSIGSIFL